MNQLNWKRAIWILSFIFALIITINWWVTGKTISIAFLFDSVSKSVTVITLTTVIFCKFLWKFKLFSKWLVLVPNLNGNWDGSIQSDWINPQTHEKTPLIKTQLLIKQSLFKISCIMKTGEMKSKSVSSSFIINPDNQEYSLLYTYISVPKQPIQERSRIHYGTMLFDMDSNYDVTKITGNYWTGRKTSGFITLTKASKIMQ